MKTIFFRIQSTSGIRSVKHSLRSYVPNRDGIHFRVLYADKRYGVNSGEYRAGIDKLKIERAHCKVQQEIRETFKKLKDLGLISKNQGIRHSECVECVLSFTSEMTDDLLCGLDNKNREIAIKYIDRAVFMFAVGLSKLLGGRVLLAVGHYDERTLNYHLLFENINVYFADRLLKSGQGIRKEEFERVWSELKSKYVSEVCRDFGVTEEELRIIKERRLGRLSGLFISDFYVKYREKGEVSRIKLSSLQNWVYSYFKRYFPGLERGVNSEDLRAVDSFIARNFKVGYVRMNDEFYKRLVERRRLALEKLKEMKERLKEHGRA